MMIKKLKNLFKRKINLPKEPPVDLLYSMALRDDHSFGLIEDETIIRSRLNSMRQLYEEVAGYGFYKWKN